MALALILSASLVAALSGLPGIALARGSTTGQRMSAFGMMFAAALGLLGTGLALTHAGEQHLELTWPLMSGGLTVAVDPLGAFFLAPLFFVGGLGAVYGLGYWSAHDHPDSACKLSFFWGTLVAGMALLILARHALVFLVGWETMALSAFMLIATDDCESPVRKAAWLYLIATHIGTLSLFAMFSLMRQATGSWDLGPIGLQQATLAHLSAIFFLALFGFGVKAGVMPLHFWLPSAHANAPSHVSAMLSGVMLKMGIYGLIRITGYLPDPPLLWGVLLLTAGAVSGVLGVAYALAQSDIKRLLAYSSVENIGIILIGLGLAMAGRSMHRPLWVVLGLAGALLHTWNHSLFKSLLFLGAGSVMHATGTREIDRLGGLAGKMPWTAALFFIGALAICALPPLNGFVGEFLLYLGLFHALGANGGDHWLGAAAAAPVLALIGALALACFVKLYGAVFLGSPRSIATVDAHEAPRTMLLPMCLLAAACLIIGLIPSIVAPVLDGAVAAWSGPLVGAGVGASAGTAAVALTPVAETAPLLGLSAFGVALFVCTGLLGLLLRRSIRLSGAVRGPTWSCGYARPTPRMQYTGSSFSQFLVHLFGRILRPRTERPELLRPFSAPTHFSTQVDDGVLDRQILPAVRHLGAWILRLRRFQQGVTQHYVLYILVTVVALLVISLPIERFVEQLFAR